MTTVSKEPHAAASIAPPLQDNYVSEEEESFIITRLFYPWLSPLISRCADAHSEGRSITKDDLLSIPRDEHIGIVYEQTFLPIWKEELVNPANPQVGPSLKAALRKSFGGYCYLGLFCKVLADAGVVGVPLMLRSQLTWVTEYAINPSSKSGHEWEGYIWALALALLVIISSYFQNASAYFTSKAFMKMRTATMLALFDKATTLPGSHGLSGRVTQMHGTDASKFIETSMFVQNIFTALPMLIGAIIALYFFIGPAAFIGLLVAIITVPPQGAAARNNGMERAFAARHGDKRINKVNEFVQGIRIIKFMSWEDQFELTTDEARQREVDHFYIMHKYRAIFVAVLTYAPMVMAFATFACAYGFGSSMQPQDVFPAFAMLNVLRAPLTIMPLAGAKLIELLVVLDRANAFLISDEQVPYVKDVDVIEVRPDAAIYIPHAVIQYDTDSVPMSASATPGQVLATKPQFDGPPAHGAPPHEAAAPGTGMEPNTKRLATLMTLDEFEIPRGQLTVVIGATAAGKSVLISTIVGENIVTEDSTVIRAGTVAYVAQEAWIMNETLKNNILMGKDYDDEVYKQALLACQLKSDLEQLPGSDATEIGERGINLSGGQKQRVAFARAVYSNRDIVLMDDPLSAVDPHVCGALFHGCIRGALAGKTRVLVTHQQQFLRWADRVVLVADLKILFNGTHAELMERKDLKEFMSSAKKKVANDSFASSASGNTMQQRLVEEEDPEVAAARHAAHEAALEKELMEGDKVAQRDFAADALLWTVPLPQAEEKKVVAVVVAPAPGDASAITPSGGKGTSLMTKEEVRADDGFFIYFWYCKMAGWHYILLTWSGYVTWRIASGFCDYMVTWWATRARPFHQYSMTQDQYLYWYAILIVIVGILVSIRMVPFVYGTINASRTVHGSMINRLLHSPMSFYDTTPAGRILNRAGKDMEMIDVVIPEGLSVFYNLILVVLGAWVVQAIAAWFMPIVYVIVLILFVFLFRGYVIANHDVKALDSVMRSPVLSIMNETLGGLATLRAYGMIESYRRNHAGRLHSMNRASYASRNLQRWLDIRTDFLTGLVIMSLVMICLGMLQNMNASDRASNLPSISLALTYVVMVSSAIGFLCTTLADLMAAFSSAERVKEYAETLPQERTLEYVDGPATLDEQNVASTAPQPPANWPEHGSVEFDHVFLRYRLGLDLVLQDVSFSVKAGEKVGVVGRTGSGKSTIMLSLFRMIETAHETHPIANRILIDGVDISHVKLHDLRTKVTIIPQDPLLFQGTVRSNLDPFNTHTDDEVWAVLEKAKMRERVEREDLGLECSVADRGANFSAGERQLLCLARALLKNCKILLLDEATASIDPKHDQIVQDTIRREFADRTVLTIAHRLGTIIDSDKVLVLDAGRVLEFGYPHDLLQRDGGQFRSMVHELGPEEEGRLRDLAKHAYDKSHERERQRATRDNKAPF